jgi:hypothetical protein
MRQRCFARRIVHGDSTDAHRGLSRRFARQLRRAVGLAVAAAARMECEYRKPRSGYKVLFVPFEKGKPSGPSEDILTGFASESGEAWGRPVGVVVDKSGALLVADD